MSGKRKKKKKAKITNLNMGDTVKLTKGRIGLVRFIGKTQFGLGEWIGIELYNELMKTRHNGAVLGKRYFRCPANRGVFIRRSLIKENIAVLDIQPQINKLRAKEKKLKQERKKLLKQQNKEKKLRNEEKRASKALKMQKKYANSSRSPPPPSTNSHQSLSEKRRIPISANNNIKSLNAHSRRNRDNGDINRSRSANPPSNGRPKTPKSPTKTKGRPKTPTRPKTKRPKTPTLKTSTSVKQENNPKNNKNKAKRRNNSRPTNMPSVKAEKYEIDGYRDEDDDDQPIFAPLEMAVAQPLVARKYSGLDKQQQNGNNNKKPIKKRKKVNGSSSPRAKSPRNRKKKSKTRTKKSNSTDSKPTSPRRVRSKSPRRRQAVSIEDIMVKQQALAKTKSTPTKPQKKARTDSMASQSRDYSQDTDNPPSPSQSPSQTPEPSISVSAGDDTVTTPIIDDLHKMDNDSSDDDDGLPMPEPNNVPRISPPKQILEQERSKIKANDYKLKGFNTDFQKSLAQRQGNDSLQLLYEKQKYEAEKKKKEQEAKESLKVKSPKQESPHQKANSINIFNNDELPQVIDDLMASNVTTKKVKGMSPKLTPIQTVSDDIKRDAETLLDGDCKELVLGDVPDDVLTPPDDTPLSPSKRKVTVDKDDGVLDSDDDSLNEEEEDELSDSELQRELEADFEKNWDRHSDVITEYEKTVDEIETGRKKLANKLVTETKELKRRKSKIEMEKKKAKMNRERAGARGQSAAAMVAAHTAKKEKRINPNLMMANRSKLFKKMPMKKKSKKKYDSARSRRGSSFVDDYNVVDTLFFDGDEENTSVNDTDQFYVDTMGDSDDDDDDDSKSPQPMSKATTPIIEEGDEDEEEESVTETEQDPLLGTIEDILEEDEDDEEDEEPEPEVKRLPFAKKKRLHKMSDIMEDNESEPQPNGKVRLDSINDDDDDDDEYEEIEEKIFKITKDGMFEKILILYQDLNEFVEWNTNEDGCGIKIEKMMKTDYGKELYIQTGIEAGWTIIQINGSDCTQMLRSMIYSKLKKCDKVRGYRLTFKKPKEDINVEDNLKPSIYMKAKRKSIE